MEMGEEGGREIICTYYYNVHYYRLQNMCDCVYHVHHNSESDMLVIL